MYYLPLLFSFRTSEIEDILFPDLLKYSVILLSFI